MTRFPRVLPPGGSGEIEVAVNSNEVMGPFEKKVMVWSDDPQNSNLVLVLSGEVKPYVILEPGGYLSFWGKPGSAPKEEIEIINNHPHPLMVTGIEHDLGDRIAWSLQERVPGRSYRLWVEDLSGGHEAYAGHLVLRTNLPMKRELTIIVKRHVN